MDTRRGFTLVELLVVIAIVAILAIVATITINPAQLLAQSRDASRISDLATLNGAITLYQSEERGYPGYSLGSSTVSYLSVPDPSAGTAGSQCQGIGMPTSTGYSDFCAASTTYRNTSSTGWMPVAFSSLPSGVPFGVLPVDPKNQTSSNLYYTYETNGTQWSLAAFFESQKYAKTMQSTGGIDPALYQVGTGITMLPEAGRGLVGYWPLNEGSGNSSFDWSGGNATGTWVGNAMGTANTHYSSGQAFQWAGVFDGQTNYVDLPIKPTLLSSTFILWVDPSQIPTPDTWVGILYSRGVSVALGLNIDGNNNTTAGYTWNNNDPNTWGWSSGLSLQANKWNFVAAVLTPAGTTMYLGVNGQLTSSFNTTEAFNNSQTATADYQIGEDSQGAGARDFYGKAAEARIYNRALSAAEIQQIYNAEK